MVSNILILLLTVLLIGVTLLFEIRYRKLSIEQEINKKRLKTIHRDTDRLFKTKKYFNKVLLKNTKSVRIFGESILGHSQSILINNKNGFHTDAKLAGIMEYLEKDPQFQDFIKSKALMLASDPKYKHMFDDEGKDNSNANPQ